MSSCFSTFSSNNVQILNERCLTFKTYIVLHFPPPFLVNFLFLSVVEMCSVSYSCSTGVASPKLSKWEKYCEFDDGFDLLVVVQIHDIILIFVNNRETIFTMNQMLLLLFVSFVCCLCLRSVVSVYFVPLLVGKVHTYIQLQTFNINGWRWVHSLN